MAAAQAESVPGDVAANVATAVTLVTAAADQGARVVVLPELFLTGYDPDTWAHDTSLALDDPVLDPVSEVAAGRSVVVVAGAAVRRALDESTVSAVVFAADGCVRATYDKQHLSGPEWELFTPGTGGMTIVVDGWDFGLGICNDGSFPAHVTAAAADGAAAYLCPAAYYSGAEHRRDLRFAARALDNGIYVVVSGLSGTCGVGVFSGGSAVYDPEGRPLGRAGGESSAVVVADLDTAEVSVAQAVSPGTSERVGPLGPRTRLELS